MKSSIGVIVASVREGRRGEGFARWIHGLLSERAEVRTELIDLRDWPLPPYSAATTPTIAEKSYAEGTLSKQWADRVRALDGFIVVVPEYNHGYPGQLKNALDHLYPAWNYKPIAFVSYGGFSAGTRAVQQLRHVAIELRMVPIRDEVSLCLVGLGVDDHGFPTAEIYAKRAALMLDELLWWTRVAKDGRERHAR